MTSFEELAAEATGEPLNEELIAEEVKEDEVSVVSSAMAEQLANVQVQVALKPLHPHRFYNFTFSRLTIAADGFESLAKNDSVNPGWDYKTIAGADSANKIETQVSRTWSEGRRRERDNWRWERFRRVIHSKHHPRTFLSTETQVQVDNSSETTVEVTSEVHIVEEMQSSEQVSVVEQKQEDVTSIHYTAEDVEKYEESQEKFRALWEKKREAVRELKEHLFKLRKHIRSFWKFRCSTFNGIEYFLGLIATGLA